jgi:Tfp pilus assembly protein PilF
VKRSTALPFSSSIIFILIFSLITNGGILQFSGIAGASGTWKKDPSPLIYYPVSDDATVIASEDNHLVGSTASSIEGTDRNTELLLAQSDDVEPSSDLSSGSSETRISEKQNAPGTPGPLSSAIRMGIEEYHEENYEEAVEILSQARKREPESSVAAFFLGMAYKQTMDFPKAFDNFRDAATHAPRIKEALIELLAMALHLDKFEEGKKWIEVAEEEEIFPAKTAFLKGQLLSKEGLNMEAAKAFEKAKEIDPSISQTAELQIALCYMKEKNFEEAKKRMDATVLIDPQSDLASFARNYQNLLKQRAEMEKPFHGTVSLFGQYNTNLLSNPKNPAYSGAEGDMGVATLSPSFRFNYTPRIEAPWIFSAQGAFAGSFNREFSTSRDSVSSSLSVTPGYSFGDYSLNLPVSYSYALLRNPGYNGYTESWSAGPLFRKIIGGNQILELYTGLSSTEYLQPPLTPEEDQDAQSWNSYISWIWLFKEGAFLNLRYEFIDEDTDGASWDNFGHKFTTSVTVPVKEKLSLQLSGEAFLQDFKNNHSLLSYLEPRQNETYKGTAGFTYELRKNTNLVVQYTRTRAYSNIGNYDYEQDLYMCGIEISF